MFIHRKINIKSLTPKLHAQKHILEAIYAQIGTT